MRHIFLPVARVVLCALCLVLPYAVGAAPADTQRGCVRPGAWHVPGSGEIAAPDILARAAGAQMVLLGESHSNADHQRWELQTVAALAGLRAKLVLGFEMFPRRVQRGLDRWVAGELSEREFLVDSDWSRVWNLGAANYLPLFHFARLNRIPMVALNVERDFVRMVGVKGWDGTPPENREGVTRPAPPSEAYLARLYKSYAEHPQAKERTPSRNDPEFHRFVEAQQVWDRAMAQALADAAARHPDALVIGIMGREHAAHGDGVAHQLDHLGVKRVASLLPWDAGAGCEALTAGLATAVFGISSVRRNDEPPPQRLGIMLEPVSDGLRVMSVVAGSIAEAAGLIAGDVLTEIAGTPVRVAAEVRTLVESMLPGAWLPLKARRENGIVELTAKFPVRR